MAHALATYPGVLASSTDNRCVHIVAAEVDLDPEGLFDGKALCQEEPKDLLWWATGEAVTCIACLHDERESRG